MTLQEEVFMAAGRVVGRYESGGFEYATEADWRLLEQLKRAVNNNYLRDSLASRTEPEAPFTD